MENKYNKLDEYIKKVLTEQVRPADWNTPENHLFENAISVVNAKKRPSNKWSLWWLLIIPFLVMSGLLVKQAQSISALNESLELSNNKLEDYRGQLVLAQAAIQKNEIDAASRKLAETDLDKQNILISESIVRSDLEASERNEMPVTSKFGKKQRDFVPSEKPIVDRPLSSNMRNSEQHLEVKVAPHEAQQIAHLPSLGLRKVTTTSDQSQFGMDDIELLPENAKRDMSYLKFVLNANQSWASMDRIPQGDMSALSEYDQKHLCYGAAIEYGQKINPRWTVFTRLGFDRYINESKSEDVSFFDEANVIEGEDMYKCAVKRPNPFGNYESTLTFRVSQDMSQNQVMNQHYENRQVLDFASLNLGAKYDILQRDRWQLGIRSMVGVGYFTRIHNAYKMSVMMNDALKYDETEYIDGLNGMNRVMLNAGLGLEVSLKLSKHLSFGIEGSYSRSLNSVRDSWPDDMPATFLHSINTGVGVQYNF